MGLRRAGVLIAAVAGAAAWPASAGATIVGLGATTDEPSLCVNPVQAPTASTSCQLFTGTPLRPVGTASRDDGSVRLLPQPFTLLALHRGQPPAPVASWTLFDGNDADDDPVIVPDRSTDYRLQFGGNADIPPGTSSTMVVGVGVRITIPTDARSGASPRVRIPVIAALASAAERGRLELRRCKRAKATSAASCAKRRHYDVVARRSVRRSGSTTFTVRMPPRSLRRMEIAFKPRAARRYAVTRQAFQLIRGFDGRTSYRYVVRRSPFGDR